MLELGLLAAAFTTIATILLALVAVYQQFGLAVLWIAVGLLHLGMQRRWSSYLDDGSMRLGGDKTLPPPGKQRLPRPGPPQIGRASKALTPSRPGPVAR